MHSQRQTSPVFGQRTIGALLRNPCSRRDMARRPPVAAVYPPNHRNAPRLSDAFGQRTSGALLRNPCSRRDMARLFWTTHHWCVATV